MILLIVLAAVLWFSGKDAVWSGWEIAYFAPLAVALYVLFALPDSLFATVTRHQRITGSQALRATGGCLAVGFACGWFLYESGNVLLGPVIVFDDWLHRIITIEELVSGIRVQTMGWLVFYLLPLALLLSVITALTKIFLVWTGVDQKQPTEPAADTTPTMDHPAYGGHTFMDSDHRESPAAQSGAGEAGRDAEADDLGTDHHGSSFPDGQAEPTGSRPDRADSETGLLPGLPRERKKRRRKKTPEEFPVNAVPGSEDVLPVDPAQGEDKAAKDAAGQVGQPVHPDQPTDRTVTDPWTTPDGQAFAEDESVMAPELPLSLDASHSQAGDLDGRTDIPIIDEPFPVLEQDEQTSPMEDDLGSGSGDGDAPVPAVSDEDSEIARGYVPAEGGIPAEDALAVKAGTLTDSVPHGQPARERRDPFMFHDGLRRAAPEDPPVVLAGPQGRGRQTTAASCGEKGGAEDPLVMPARAPDPQACLGFDGNFFDQVARFSHELDQAGPCPAWSDPDSGQAATEDAPLPPTGSGLADAASEDWASAVLDHEPGDAAAELAGHEDGDDAWMREALGQPLPTKKGNI